MATIESRKIKIKTTLKSHESIFDIPANNIKLTDTRGFSTGLIFVPNCVSINDPAAGIPLKDGVGFLSLREEVDSSGKRLGYLYRFTSDEYIYLGYSASFTP